MNPATLLDRAALLLVFGAMLIAFGVRNDWPLLIVVAYLPVRWGLVRVVEVCARPSLPPPADRPFGYEQGGPVR
jgi:uncharacterized membrane protein